ncbi:MAG: UDP-N-acetylenolpyruvoylglucosamine reductase [Candidatus Vogelbacteria bacterium RIFOXYD1_FULL_46_19]|uniref:UDP-N-acetylenolpyruvoylglucosamine reductase n=1 Tax=Candidatus Vogelbacteria bacterium RIFOXYD1_FULL_46_19 TaxID=1802439 RepID=A0A1G2QHS5_9BACT|nr:MAG: UDP-N-acetylenolpyruvoylglucosamine reductase [Candidatus Vogelbacteria bacterium RIFOXYD1_FULL_46_19]
MTVKNLKQIWPTGQTKVSLAELTTFKIGGVAPFYLAVKDKQSLVEAVKKAQTTKISYVIFAGGSNVVFPGRPSTKLYIHYLTNPLAKDALTIGPTGQVYVEAGLSLASLIKKVISQGRAGLESLSGIPGTVGGAVVGNAGAYGQSISDHLLAVEIFDGQVIRWVDRVTCRFNYRDSIFKYKPWLVLGVKFKLTKGNTETLTKKSRQIIKIRQAKYKPGLACPGSYFKNPLVSKVSARSLKLVDPTKIIDGKIPAGYLLEVVGAKGLKQGQMAVVDFHGNLIMNLGGGTASDAKKLATRLKQKVQDRFGITLEEEVRFLP